MSVTPKTFETSPIGKTFQPHQFLNNLFKLIVQITYAFFLLQFNGFLRKHIIVSLLLYNIDEKVYYTCILID